MNIEEIVIGEATKALLLIHVVFIVVTSHGQ
jgi:hypothetical protein